jgi:hypothetical protein
LFAFAYIRHSLSRLRADILSIIWTSTRRVGADNVVDIPPICDPGCDCASSHELGIVRMRDDYQRDFPLLWLLGCPLL